jgi:hypothetical protein
MLWRLWRLKTSKSNLTLMGKMKRTLAKMEGRILKPQRILVLRRMKPLKTAKMLMKMGENQKRLLRKKMSRMMTAEKRKRMKSCLTKSLKN